MGETLIENGEKSLEKWAFSGRMNGPARGVVSTPADHFTTEPFREGTAMPRQSSHANGTRQPGSRNPNWKGGRVVASNGYVLIKVGRGHHLADVRGYAYEHRVVAEQGMGRRLLKGEEVHHVNGVKHDNRPENLEVTGGRADHAVRHRKREDLRLPGGANPKTVCACGCGQSFPRYDADGRPRSFVSGHNRQTPALQERLLEVVANGPGSLAQIAAYTGQSPQAVKVMASQMTKAGRLIRVGRGIYRKAV